jgi:2-oxoglutarate dehydrogenase E2 component (dihydrolipoamide succinyltransferase)
MNIELKVPALGESINEVEIGEWLRKEGDGVEKDQPVVALESEKATVELPAPEQGTLKQVLKRKGETAKIGEVIGYMETGAPVAGARPTAGRAPDKKSSPDIVPAIAAPGQGGEARVMPSAEVLLARHGLRPEQVRGTGPGGRILKEDVLRQVAERESAPAAATMQTAEPQPAPSIPGRADREEEIVPMSRLRRTVAERLIEAQRTAALLTTFNEIDMSAVVGLRKQYGELFQSKYQVKLGFMSFFVKAAIDALKEFPSLNAEVRGTSIAYHNYYDIGVAVGGGKGLVVPVLRNAERMSFAEIELAIGDFGRRAKENRLKLEELQGGTFTISNGGVYGSLLSTPIVNPPQSGVLGLHAIQDRPVAREGNVVVRPMMYIALTYDHRLVDGREAVSFLKRIKDLLETPTRMLMEI